MRCGFCILYRSETHYLPRPPGGILDDSLLTYMKSLGPSAVDFELSTLRHDPGFPELVAFLDAVAFWMKAKKEIELVEAYLNVFLKV